MKLPQEMIVRARQADLVAFCRSMGEKLEMENPAKGEWRISGKQGLIIQQNHYYWHGSPNNGGKLSGQGDNDNNNAISFVMHFYKFDFKKAVNALVPFASPDAKVFSPKNTEAKKIIAIEAASNNEKVIDYLTKTRCISEEIIIDAIQNGLLFQEKGKNNCVFVCKNSLGVITGYEVKGVLDIPFKCNYGSGIFNWLVGEPKKLLVFESAIDLLSFYEIAFNYGDVNNALLCSMGGLSKAEKIKQIALKLSENNPDFEVKMLVDNDKAGENFFNNFYKRNNKNFKIGYATPQSKDNKIFKDWNEFLVHRKNKKRG